MSVSPSLFWLLLPLTILFAAAFAGTLSFALRQRVRMKLRPNFGKSPVPHVAIDRWIEIFKSTGLGPNRDCEIAFIGQSGALASINDTKTYVLARNAPDDAKIDTLTYFDDGTGDAKFNANDPEAEKWKKIALGESRYDKFYYEDTPVAHKVAQHFGDSAKALRMVSPGGFVLWHDYSPRCPGVYKALNELGHELPLAYLKGTTLVAYREPA